MDEMVMTVLEWGPPCNIIATVNDDNTERSIGQQRQDWREGQSWCINATTPIGSWSIVKWAHKDTFSFLMSSLGPCNTLEEAKAVAQADYEARLRRGAIQ